jgi:hypothetical protein
MDADELARIAAALVGAIADASARVKEFGIDSQFRELVRHAREMHDLFVDAMLISESLRTENLPGLNVTAENAIEHLEMLARMPDGKMQYRTTKSPPKRALAESCVYPTSRLRRTPNVEDQPTFRDLDDRIRLAAGLIAFSG